MAPGKPTGSSSRARTISVTAASSFPVMLKAIASAWRAGTKLELSAIGATVLALGLGPLPAVSFDIRERRVRLGELLVGGNRFERRLFRRGEARLAGLRTPDPASRR